MLKSQTWVWVIRCNYIIVSYTMICFGSASCKILGILVLMLAAAAAVVERNRQYQYPWRLRVPWSPMQCCCCIETEKHCEFQGWCTEWQGCYLKQKPPLSLSFSLWLPYLLNNKIPLFLFFSSSLQQDCTTLWSHIRKTWDGLLAQKPQVI